MKRILSLLVVVLLTQVSCKKFIDQKKEDYLMKVITSGEWYVEQYLEADVNVTSEFLNYKFRFTDDYKVKGILGTDTTQGTWAGNISDETISANFGTSAPAPLPRLNGDWEIMDGYTNFVKARRITSAGTLTLSLRLIE